MASRSKPKQTTVLLDNPLEGEDLLRNAMYGPGKPAPRPARRAAKPEHYKIVSISLYTEDIARLERMVQTLKRRGVYKANKSQLIRHALRRLELDDFDREDFET